MAKNYDKLLDKVENRNLPGVYLIERKSDGKKYVGQTSGSIVDRLQQHIKNENVDKNSRGIDAAIKREGKEEFRYSTLIAVPDASTEQLWFLEAYFIEKYNSRNNGFNLTVGNHIEEFSTKVYGQKHKVSVEITKKIQKHFKFNFRDAKRVLLIGNYTQKFKDYLDYEGCEVVNIMDAYDNFYEILKKELEEMENKEFDIIISNPPYGDIGREVTNKVHNIVSFNEFVSIQPLSDLTKFPYEIYAYVDTNSVLYGDKSMFPDADTKTVIVKLTKKRNYYKDVNQFIVKLSNSSLERMLYKNIETSGTVFDVAGQPHRDTEIDVDRSFISHYRDFGYGYGGTKSSTARNFNEFKIYDDKKLRYSPSRQNLQWTVITFNSSKERQNFVKFVFSEEGHKFIEFTRKLFNVDTLNTGIFLPKLADWNRPQSVRTILKTYGYTDSEIEDVFEEVGL